MFISIILFLLAIVSLVISIIALIKPSITSIGSKPAITRGKILGGGIGLALILFISSMIIAPTPEPKSDQTQDSSVKKSDETVASMNNIVDEKEKFKLYFEYINHQTKLCDDASEKIKSVKESKKPSQYAYYDTANSAFESCTESFRAVVKSDNQFKDAKLQELSTKLKNITENYLLSRKNFADKFREAVNAGSVSPKAMSEMTKIGEKTTGFALALAVVTEDEVKKIIDLK